MKNECKSCPNDLIMELKINDVVVCRGMDGQPYRGKIVQINRIEEYVKVKHDKNVGLNPNLLIKWDYNLIHREKYHSYKLEE